MDRIEPSLPLPQPPLLTPSVEDWRAMSADDREAFVEQVRAALQREWELAPAEGVPHISAKFGIRAVLDGYYSRIGRKIYLATELAILFPGEPAFAPDFMAVADVEETGEDDTRMAWVVADEGKGPDLVLEVLHAGSRQKDLYENVRFYAELGIAEYFVFDRKRLALHGFRLPAAAAGRYGPIPARGGVLASAVLGLDLSIEGHKLRFSHAGAVIPEVQELLGRATRMLDAVEARAEAAEQRAEAEAQRADVAAQRAEIASQRADAAEAARAELERRLAELLASKS